MPEFKDIDEVLKELGLPVIEKIQPDPSKQQDLRRDLEEELKRISDADIDVEEGGFKVKIGDHHFRLSGSLWPILNLGAKLVFAAHQPHAGIATGQALLEFFSKMRELITKLDPAERVIYESVAGVSESKRLLGRSDKGASVEDLRERFRQEDQVVPVTLEEDLKRMAEPEKGVLSRHNYQDRGPYYQVVF
jgi:hypothetical protein